MRFQHGCDLAEERNTLSTFRIKVCKLGMLSQPRIKSLEHSHQSHLMPGSVSIVLRNGLSWSGSPMHPAPDMGIMGSSVQERHRNITDYNCFSWDLSYLFPLVFLKLPDVKQRPRSLTAQSFHLRSWCGITQLGNPKLTHLKFQTQMLMFLPWQKGNGVLEHFRYPLSGGNKIWL